MDGLMVEVAPPMSVEDVATESSPAALQTLTAHQPLAANIIPVVAAEIQHQSSAILKVAAGSEGIAASSEEEIRPLEIPLTSRLKQNTAASATSAQSTPSDPNFQF
ncbi:OLC1v1008651C1 [Oldenlandia corymbosa var. corymbosa]|uniref:OLC1v1008651C1 n=1 Tax=Oldenlandia corymbosa var. corymbosa TaxID=529605 RepID=A0AAV1DMH3_OLDCO|nr:OLC1v1008651C1 [Oldenlandia corymbosa var. corymbosa]